MAWICNWFTVVMEMVVLGIISAENITTTTPSSTPTTSTSSTTSTTLPSTPTTSTTTNAATPTNAVTTTSTTPSVSSHTTPDQKTITLTSVTLGLLVSLAIVGLLALILLLLLLFRVLYLRVRKPDREAEADPKKRGLVKSSSYRMSTGPDFSVSPVEIFPAEEVCSFDKKDPAMVIINERPSENMQTNDVVHGNKGGKDIPDNLYVNDLAVHKGRKRSDPSILLDGMPNIKMPTLPQGSTKTGTPVKEPRDSITYAIPFAHPDTPDPAHAGDDPASEYTYADLMEVLETPVLEHRPTDRLQNEDDTDLVKPLDYTYITDFPVLAGEVEEDEYASVHDSDDDCHEYSEPTEMTGVVSRKPTTNHYNNQQMLNTEGRKAHTHKVKQDM